MTMRITLALAAIAVVGALCWVLTSGQNAQHFQTAPSEQKGLELADGSIVQINSNSAISVDLTPRERNVNLLRGEARFRVAKDRERPFLVYTPFAKVRATGTIFNVRIEAGRTAVTVVEGEVEVVGDATDESPLMQWLQSFMPGSNEVVDGRVVLRAGQNAAVASKQSMWINDGPSIAHVNAWPVKLIKLQDMRLADLVAELNRYRSSPIIIADARLAGLEVNGSVNVYDPGALLDFLAKKQDVKIEQRADEALVLTKP
jgi:transmembrane sensor